MDDKPVPVTLRGYLYIIVETIALKDTEKHVSAHLSIGTVAKCQTTVKKSGSPWNQVFMIEVSNDPSRLVVEAKDGETLLGDCRYDVNPFFDHPGAAHSISSQLFNQSNEIIGNITMKVTYYSAEHGKLKVRIFYLSLLQAFVDKFKHAKVKVKIGVYAQSTPVKELGGQFDEDVQLIILSPHLNIVFEVVHEEGVLATYTIYDLEKSGLLIDTVKAYQVSLFNNDKAVGSIKYQIEWIKKTV